MAGWLEADRTQEHGARWLLGDLALAGVFVWITIVSLRSNAYVDEYGAVEGVGWLLALSPTLLLPFRRHAPALTLAAATLLYLVASATQGDSNAPLAAPFFAYSVGVTRPVRPSGAMIVVAAAVLSTTTLYGPGDADALIPVVWAMLLSSGWLIGASIRHGIMRADRLGQRVEHLERHRAEVARAAILDERARIARELHDAVGHTVNVIVLQAGAARLAADPRRAIDALGEIETLGRSALTDLDHMLGLLAGADDLNASPQRTVSDIVSLVDDMRAAGADISLDNRCRCDLDWRTGAAAHRIAQEALTNAIKHAGDAHIDVTISCAKGHLRLEILDDGVGDGRSPTAAGGRGIPGMTERANVLGGRLTAGPGRNGGFVVEASLPKAPQHGHADPSRAEAS